MKVNVFCIYVLLLSGLLIVSCNNKNNQLIVYDHHEFLD